MRRALGLQPLDQAPLRARAGVRVLVRALLGTVSELGLHALMDSPPVTAWLATECRPSL